MTTIFFNYQICTFNILLSWRFPRKKEKQRFWTIFLSAPHAPPPLESGNFFSVVSPSLNFCRGVGVAQIIARYVAQWGIAQMCLRDTKYEEGGGCTTWGAANLPEKIKIVVSDMGYCSDSIAMSRGLGPLRPPERTITYILISHRIEKV